MSVSPSQLKLFAATTMATSLTTANVGGAISATEVLGATIGEVFFTMAAPAESEGDQPQISKTFYKNTNTTDDLTDAKIWLANALDAGDAGNYPVSLQSSNVLDGSTYKGRCQGLDTAGDPLQAEVTLAGTTEVFTGLDFSVVHSVETRNATTGVLQALNGTLTVRRNGDIIGVIPAGYYSANTEVNIGLAAALNDTATTADAETDPSGITFSRPRTYADGLAVAGDDLTAEDAQGIWFKWIQPERRKPTPDQQVLVGIRGATA